MSKYLVLLIFISITLVACGNETPTQTTAGFDTPIPNQVEVHHETAHDGHTHEHIEETQATAALEVTLVASELVIGPNRFAVGLLDGERRIVHEAAVHFHYYNLSNPATPVLESEADATPLKIAFGVSKESQS